MWVKTRGDQPTKEDYEALVRRVEVLEKKLADNRSVADLPKRKISMDEAV